MTIINLVMEIQKCISVLYILHILYPGKVLAGEWLKFRYGVFEEHGYVDDPLYPHAFFDARRNQTRPTAGTEADLLEGQWKDR